ncbi:MAG: sodium:solute symporter family protein [Deltaproteobacteria bacterium]|nr:sodium:solute symporter family protein [Deltaproteobacteria bacterium]
MTLEALLVVLYLLGCIAIGLWAARRSLSSADDLWVAGRKIGVWANALAIMAALASGGSIIGVMGLAYKGGIPYALSLFAGAVLGFPLAAILVAAPLRRLGKFTLSDFFVFRYPHPAVRTFVPLLILLSFSVYIVAQMKAAGITAEVLLGLEYKTAVTIATVVFVAYVSVGGMLAVTWTDIVQGVLMLGVILITAGALLVSRGSPLTLLTEATTAAPALGTMLDKPLASLVGIFVLWAAAIPVTPHIVMRVLSAKDAAGARLSLNLAMIFYSVMILAAVLVIVPVGKSLFPELADADRVFLSVMEGHFPALLRGLAVAAVLAAVMSTTDALLLACSAAVTHDLLGERLARASEGTRKAVTLAVPWIIGLVAMFLAYSPPKLITIFYSLAIGLLAAGLFVPLVAGLWWRRATTLGGLLSMISGAGVYAGVELSKALPTFSGALLGLGASALVMVVASLLTPPPDEALVERLTELHQP